MNNLTYKGYTGSVEYDSASDCLCGKVLGMNKDSITYEGKTLNELKADFMTGIDSYIEGCAELGIEPRKAFSGSLNVRLSPDIHSRIALMAQEAGVTINAFIKKTLEDQLRMSHN